MAKKTTLMVKLFFRGRIVGKFYPNEVPEVLIVDGERVFTRLLERVYEPV